MSVVGNLAAIGLLPALVLATAAMGAPARPTISVRQVSAAAARCGMPGLKVVRDRPGRRSFTVGEGQAQSWATPLSAEQERELREGARNWHCFVRWAKRRHVSIAMMPPPIRIF
jgi:hypothetical protein